MQMKCVCGLVMLDPQSLYLVDRKSIKTTTEGRFAPSVQEMIYQGTTYICWWLPVVGYGRSLMSVEVPEQMLPLVHIHQWLLTTIPEAGWIFHVSGGGSFVSVDDL